MHGQSSMFGPETSVDTSSATSSQGSADGRTRSGSQDSRESAGPGVVPANPSPWQAQERARLTKDTYGPLFDGLSPSAGLQRCLESRLRERLDGYGSPEYELTWKHLDMVSGPPILQRRALARRTSGRGFTGWPTVTVDDANNVTRASGDFQSLSRTAQLSGWPTTTTMGHIERTELRPSRVATNRTGGYIAEVLAGMPTAGWLTPSANEDAAGTLAGNMQQMLSHQAQLVGLDSESYVAGTERPDGSRLNPLFSLWLQGYPPAEWASCAVPGTR